MPISRLDPSAGQDVLRAPPEPRGILPPEADSGGEVGTYVGAGGRSLRFRVVDAEPRRHTLLYLHGIESHGTWFLPTAEALRRFGCVTYLLDRRGSGLNIAVDPGDAASPRVLLEDVERFRRHVGDPELHVVGLSWGGKLAIAAALERRSRVRSLVLVTPGLRSRLRPAPLTTAKVILGLVFAGGRNRVELPIEPEMFSSSAEVLRFIREDPQRLQRVTSRFLLTSFFLERRIARRARELEMPVLVCLAGRDPIVDNDAVLSMLSRVRRRTVHLFPNAVHSIQFDERASLVRLIGDFVEMEAPSC